MNIEKYNYLWTTKKDEYVLVNTKYGYGIVNKKEQSVLSKRIGHWMRDRSGHSSELQKDNGMWICWKAWYKNWNSNTSKPLGLASIKI